MSLRLIVHAGVDSSAAPEALRGLERAATTGFAVLGGDGDALSAVEATVGVLEEDPQFNAGFGSVLNEEGQVETDAGVVTGHDGRFAAVAALAGVRRPIEVAAELLRRAPGPVLLAGDGARRFASLLRMQLEDLRTAEQLSSWEEARRGDAWVVSPFTGRLASATDTVGAIAVDGHGRLAAGSSTGGVQLKLPGRVGDSAVFGAGIYADAARAALCSGLGEAVIELTLAYRAVASCSGGDGAEAAAARAVELLEERDATGGLVLYDAPNDRLAVAHNACSFPVILHDGDGPRLVRTASRPGRRRG